MPRPDTEILSDPPVFPERILVTGGSGFVGARLVRRLIATAPDSRVLPVHGPWATQASQTIDGPVLDLTDAAAVADMIQAFAPDVVVHLAAFSSVGLGEGQGDRVWASNFDATRNLAGAARDLGRARGRPTRLVFASTAEVYGLGFNDGPRDETSALAPASTYARSKAACEYLLRDMAGPDLGVIVLRLFNHTGPGQAESFVVPALAAQLARLAPGDEPVIRVGNLEAQRDFTDVEDVVEAYMAVLAGSSEPGMAVYNVGSGRAWRIQSILDVLLRQHGAPVRVVQDPARMRASDVPLNAGLFDRFAQAYGWSPRRDFETTIRDIHRHETARAQSRPAGSP